MIDLDSRASVTALDPGGMLGLFEGFADQCRESLRLSREVSLPAYNGTPRLVGLSGMGGSAAGGDFTRALFEEQGVCPFYVNRDYHLPKYVGKDDVFILASYSGNTEETVSAFEDARKAGAKMIVVTSGGKLADLANQHGLPLFQVPGGLPPRAALGYMFVPLVVLCERYGFIKPQPYDKAFDLVEKCRGDWSVDNSEATNEAKQLARALHGKAALLYGLGIWQGIVANRWKGQFNENSKVLAFPNSFPEQNHNEILGWVKAQTQGVKQWAGVILEDGNESAKMKARAQVTMDLTKDRCEWHSARARGESLLERMLTLASFGDFVSIYMARLNEIDPINIDWINHLKSELGKIPV